MAAVHSAVVSQEPYGHPSVEVVVSVGVVVVVSLSVVVVDGIVVVVGSIVVVVVVEDTELDTSNALVTVVPVLPARSPGVTDTS
jgi:hypothetical protein